MPSRMSPSESQLGTAPTFGRWMLIGVPVVVVMLAVAWVLLLVSGKPKRYATEFIEWIVLRMRWKADLAGSFCEPAPPRENLHPILKS